MIILLSGKAGVGKTTVADMLKNVLSWRVDPIIIASFAHRLKQTAHFMGWDGLKDDAGRKLLQDIGKVGRDYDINMWVKPVLHASGKQNITIVDDWRFPNEYEYLAKNYQYGAVVRVKVYGRMGILNGSLAEDVSETALDSYDVDYSIWNTSGEDALSARVNDFTQWLAEEYATVFTSFL